MSIPISAHGASDVGRVRTANEDAYFLGYSVFAVADGMGGHAAGEVASATALGAIEELDGKIFADGATAASNLAAAVVAANDQVARKAADEPHLQGMGTTLTAAMIEGRRVHFAHVGDSRAYLLRRGHFSQLTDDHTFVQHLIDEGQITREEAAQHPHRSIITRAIGVSTEVDVDSMSLDLESGDQVLLCSDGLTGALDDAAIAAELSAGSGIEDTVAHLISRANDAGGPDNITVILLRADAPDGEARPAFDGATAAVPAGVVAAGGSAADSGEPGTARSSPVRRTPGHDSDDGRDWADRIGRYGMGSGATGPAAGRGDRRHGPTRRQRLGAAVLAVVVLATVAVVGGRWLLSRSFYVGLDDGQVVVYRGIAGDLGPIDLNWVAERSDLTAAEVSEFFRASLADGVPAASLADARRIIAEAPRRGGNSGNDATGTAGA